MALTPRIPRSVGTALLATVISLAVGALLVMAPIALFGALASVVGLVIAARYLTAPQFAAVAFVAYLPLDWILVLGLDSVGTSAGRLARPLLTLALAAACFLARPTQSARVPTLVISALSVTIGISLLQLLNPDLPDLKTAAIGVQTRLLPLVLLPAGLYLALKRSALTSLARAFAWVMVASGIVLILQVVRGDTLIEALGLQYPVFSVAHNGISVNRYPGPFLGAGLGMVMLFAFAAFVGFGHLLHRRGRLLLLTAWLGWAIALFANNQRSLFLFLVVDAPLVLLLGRFGDRLRRLPIFLLLVIPAALLAGGAFLTRAESITQHPDRVVIQEHIVDPLNNRVALAVHDAPWGQGLGSAAPGARFLTQDTTYQTTPESFLASTIVETGVPGAIAYCLLFALLAGALLHRALTAEDVTTRRFCAATLAITLWVMQLAVAYEPLSYFPFAPLYWLFVGIAFGLPRTPLEQP